MRSFQRPIIGSVVIILLLLYVGIAYWKNFDDVDSLLPLEEIRFADNGDLVGWQVKGLGGGESELIESGQSFLTLQLISGGQDISDQIDWRRLSPRPGALGQFAGTHSVLALEIRRDYRPGVTPGTIVHDVHIAAQRGASLADYRVFLKIRASLRKHAADDGSLGDIFYGYDRFFATSSKSDDVFELVRDKRQAAVAALAVRHLAVVIAPEFVGDDEMTVDPKSGVRLALDSTQSASLHRQVFEAVELQGGSQGDRRYRAFLYSEMWGPLRGLAQIIERAIQALAASIGNPGVAIVIFALLLRAMMLPLALWSIRQQRSFAAIQQQMRPEIERISNEFKGAEKSERVLQTYKEYGISPFSGLKGSMALFVQLPILIALFSVTTESALFRDASFCWVSDLSMPDRVYTLSFSIPGLGHHVNMLPILLGIISIVATLIHARNSFSGAAGTFPSGLVLALIFVVFFYSCAAALVLYWMAVNVSQIIEGLYVVRSTPSRAN